MILNLNINEEIMKKIEKKIEGTNYNVETFILYILSETLNEDEEKIEHNSFTDKEEKKIKKMLKSLGYMD